MWDMHTDMNTYAESRDQTFVSFLGVIYFVFLNSLELIKLSRWCAPGNHLTLPL